MFRRIHRISSAIIAALAYGLLMGAVQSRMLHFQPPRPFDTTDCKGLSMYGRLEKKFEPSDMVWQPSTNTLFVVSDGGKIGGLTNIGTPDGSGTPAEIWDLGGDFDLEGCTLVAGRDDFIYLGNEVPASIVEYNLKTSSVTRRWDLQATFDAHPVADPDAKADNNGLESLVFMSSPDVKSGGYFYAGRQADAQIFVYDIPLDDPSGSATLMGIIDPPGQGYDLSAMTLWRNNLWLLYDKPKELRAVEWSNAMLSPTARPVQKVNAKGLQNTRVGTLSFSVRGQEAIQFVQDPQGKQWVFVGVDPPKRKGPKDLLRFELEEFFDCFADAGTAAIPP
ncbi:uncharacterized protein EV422DRAFT_564293 [Fimicolochytrium jonesii]|uniref:uncharacterized protein n=1 Tax=Fimicolochytrium jonesii TaxID=1396493 RepID=UPI0022FF0240|nr:uncharacterized protein EV422DRAFT_564293 [Fimicolochytrium jonesii]KAI8824933.1 hypothetical protein EV422DRAFT_564293 [Fimicolochytrium jonesii]